jgi:hypothetical protein
MNYEEIRERAEVVFDYIEDKINYGYEEDGTDLLDAYKATFALKHKSIAQYKRAFRDSNLEFCIGSVEAIYEDYAFALSGYSGLAWEEKEILRELLDNIVGGPRRGPSSL